ncbi:MAG: hypothetical protein KDA81_03010 [Planctomycetaceae bacterium]|nr:hypothetical protein [Planctomycetaceae bacterium]
MPGNSPNRDLTSRVHEGHLLNFVRKVNSADDLTALVQVRKKIGLAVELGMLNADDQELLEEYIQQRYRDVSA